MVQCDIFISTFLDFFRVAPHPPQKMFILRFSGLILSLQSPTTFLANLSCVNLHNLHLVLQTQFFMDFEILEFMYLLI